jgi:DNA-binding NarL/FixJ family response regulator
MIKLAIVDDDLRLSSSLRDALIGLPEIVSIHTCDSGYKFMEALSAMIPLNRPDVVLMDISMRLPTEGIDTTRYLKEKFPDLLIIMFTISDDDDHIFESFKAGAVGYLLKNESPVFIAKTIADVKNGDAQVSPGIARKMIRFFSLSQKEKSESSALGNEYVFEMLSIRELEILELAAKGYTYQHIADTLFIASGTVKKHIRNIFEKLQVNNKIEALKKIGKFPLL